MVRLGAGETFFGPTRCSAMSPLLGFLVLVLLALVGWLFVKHQEMAEKVRHLEARVTRLYTDLYRLARGKTGAAVAPESPPPLPANPAEPSLEQEIAAPLAPMTSAAPEPPPLLVRPEPMKVPRELA